MWDLNDVWDRLDKTIWTQTKKEKKFIYKRQIKQFLSPVDLAVWTFFFLMKMLYP